MTGHIETRRVHDLCQLFEQLRALYVQLGEVLQSRLAAMRCADVPAMEECAQHEQRLVQQLQDRLGLRKLMMEAIGTSIGASGRNATQITVQQLGRYLGESQRVTLRSAADGLAAVMAWVAHLNRVAAFAARETLNHLRWVFAAVKPSDESAGYGIGGARMAVGGAIAFETVG